MEKETRDYYDDFAQVYEAHRHYGYHHLIDELEFAVLRPFAEGRRVLEAGCGTGLILKRAAEVAERAVGVDLSPGMLEKAKARGLEVSCSDLCALPFENGEFDTVYSFKVLAHVEAIESAIAEMARVTRAGGHLVLEFYNPLSLRGLVKRLKPATRITGGTTDEQVFTRFDRLSDVLSYLPEDLEFIDTRGIRIITPFASVHNVPMLRRVFGFCEHRLTASPLRGLAGFLVVILRRKS